MFRIAIFYRKNQFKWHGFKKQQQHFFEKQLGSIRAFGKRSTGAMNSFPTALLLEAAQ